jgi:hypothetical protein
MRAAAHEVMTLIAKHADEFIGERLHSSLMSDSCVAGIFSSFAFRLYSFHRRYLCFLQMRQSLKYPAFFSPLDNERTQDKVSYILRPTSSRT